MTVGLDMRGNSLTDFTSVEWKPRITSSSPKAKAKAKAKANAKNNVTTFLCLLKSPHNVTAGRLANR
jgi:hypothetical protein